MQTLLRIVFRFLAKITGIAIGLACALILISRLIQWDASPGIVAIARDHLGFWIGFIVFLVAVLFFITVPYVLLLARRQASGAGLSLLQYLDLPQKQKDQLYDRLRSRGP